MSFITLIDSRINRILPAKHKSILYVLFFFLALIFLSPETQPPVTGIRKPVAISTTPQFASPKFQELINSEMAARAAMKAASRLVLQVAPGDNLSTLFKEAGLDAQTVYMLINSSPEAEILSNLHPGFTLALEVDTDNSLRSLEVFKNPLESDLFKLTGKNQFSHEQVNRTPEVRHVLKEATITDSLFLAAKQRNIPDALTLELAGIFGGVIDFILDTKSGDSLNIIYEEKYHEGSFIDEGNILAAQYINQGQIYTAVRYEDLNGDINFYNLEGESMRKAFLLNPVDFTRISSNFNLSRKHPILNTIRAHRGTDYAAPAGTPVVATADGKVSFTGRKGSFGKLIVINHGAHFETKYAHLKDYARGIKQGVQVRQGEVIGYVGSTGGATGPHLHYEFLIDGVHRNSRAIHESLPQAISVAEGEMPRFKEQADRLISQFTVHNGAFPQLAQHLTANSGDD